MGVGNFIMKSRDNSANNLSNILDKSANTNSTYETPKRNSAKLVLNPSFSSRREPLIKKRLSTESRYNSSISNNISQITGNKLIKSDILNYMPTEPKKESNDIFTKLLRNEKIFRRRIPNQKEFISSLCLQLWPMVYY